MARASTAAANDSGELDALWSVPPEKFVAARNAAIAERKAAGDAKGAAQLKAMKRPSPSAWLVNALVREAPKDLDALFRAGDALIAAQGRVLGGADPSEMHVAMRGVREATARAMKRARALLTDNDRKPTADLTRRVTHTLRSASLDRRLRDVVLEGRLTSDPSADDLDALADVKLPKRVRVAEKKPIKKAPPREDEAAKQRAEREARAAAAREARDAERARAREEREAKKRAAHEARERLRAEVNEAAEATEEARRALARAVADERRAKSAAAEAASEVRRAKQALTTAEQRHARAKKRREV